MEPLGRHLLGHAFNNAWANQRLLGACARLSAADHRGQAHAMLSGTPVAPPQLDEFFCVFYAPRRAAELRAMGPDEAMIWGSS